MLADKNYMKIDTNDKIRCEEYPDYQNIFKNVPDQMLKREITYFTDDYQFSNSFKFLIKVRFKKKFNEIQKKKLKTFKRYYKITDMYCSHFQLHNVIKFVNNSNVLFTSEKYINNINLIKGEKKNIYLSRDSKYLDYNKNANMIVSNDLEKAVIYNIKTKSKIENVKFYDNDELLGRMVFFERENSDPFLTAVGNHKTIYLWDIKKQKNFANLDAINYVNDVAYIEKKNSFIFAMDSLDIISKDLRDNKSIIYFKGHKGNNFTACKIDDNFFSTGGEDGRTIIWDYRKNDKIYKEFQSKKPIYSIKYSKKKNMLACLQSGMQIDLFYINDKIVKKDEINFYGIATGIDINENGDKLAVGINEVFPGLLIFDI